MNVAQLRAVSAAIQANVPVLLWGPPGIGKTAQVTALGHQAGLHVETVIASIREPSDFAGLPVRTPDGVTLAPPDWALRLAHSDRDGLLFLDELSSAPPAVQAALLRVVQERTVGDLPLPDTVAVIAAANPPELAADGWDLPAATATRFMHLHVSVDHAYRQQWLKAITTGFNHTTTGSTVRGVGHVPADRLSEERAKIAGFISRHTSRLHDLPNEAIGSGRPWPCPRSWDNTARVLACVATDDTAVQQHVATGLVGDAAAGEFLLWRRHLDLPDPEAVLAGTQPIDWTDGRDDRLFVILGSVVAAVAANLTAERWRQAFERLAEAATAHRLDVALPHASSLCQHMPAGVVELPVAAEAFIEPLERAGMLPAA